MKNRTLGQVASFSAASADPPSAANKNERHVLSESFKRMVGHKLAEARFHPPYDYSEAFG